jgi:hypothetical protein
LRFFDFFEIIFNCYSFELEIHGLSSENKCV